MDDLIRRQDALDAFGLSEKNHSCYDIRTLAEIQNVLDDLPSAQEDFTEMKQEFLRMASYIDCLLECSDEQKETLMGFISRLAEYMPWTEND